MTEERILWLTDTFDDHNGVSMVLQSMLHEIRERDLPIDLLVCSNNLKASDHLIVLKPVSEFRLPVYRQQPFRIPNYIALQRIFRQGRYTHILCSTEGPMGMAALYLKRMWPVKAYFYLHTDWLTFSEKVFQWEQPGRNRLQRLLRAYYRNFDGIFVLNSEQKDWLSGEIMRLNPSTVLMTAHWADPGFIPKEVTRKDLFGLEEEIPVVIFTGRISHEKGVFDLPGIYRRAAESVPRLKMVITGTGPAADELQKLFPEAIYTGWIDHKHLPDYFSAADLLILPSRFDTFSCVTLESMSCGLPVLAYNAKGPRDIIRNGETGFLVDSPAEMSDSIIRFFSDRTCRKKFSESALTRAREYDRDIILEQLLRDLGLQRRA